jgi:hypothetical protein
MAHFRHNPAVVICLLSGMNGLAQARPQGRLMAYLRSPRASARLVVSGVPADHGEREVPGVANIDDRQ